MSISQLMFESKLYNYVPLYTHFIHVVSNI